MAGLGHIRVHLWGEFAHWSNPVTKPDRDTYDVPTVSGMHGVLGTILHNPDSDWNPITRTFDREPVRIRVRTIGVQNPVQRMSFGTNEIKTMANVDAWLRGDEGGDPINVTEVRTQRTTTALKKVSYIVTFDIIPPKDLSPAEQYKVLVKHREMWRRWLRKGRCQQQPYFGMRPYIAWFEPADGSEKLLDWTAKLPPMVFGHSYGRSLDRIIWMPEIENGLITIPDVLYDEWLRILN